MDLNELISEHEHLVALLLNTINTLTAEYNKQSKELQQYKSRIGGVNKVRIVMDEFKRGKLYDSHGYKVSIPKQALAIALSEQRRYGSGLL